MRINKRARRGINKTRDELYGPALPKSAEMQAEGWRRRRRPTWSHGLRRPSPGSNDRQREMRPGALFPFFDADISLNGIEVMGNRALIKHSFPLHYAVSYSRRRLHFQFMRVFYSISNARFDN